MDKNRGSKFAVQPYTKILVIVKRVITLERAIKHRTDTKNKRIKINNFTRSNREKPNIANAIWKKKYLIAPYYYYFAFCVTNIIFVDYK